MHAFLRFANPVETSSYVITSPTEAITVTDIATVPDVAKQLERTGPITIREIFPDGTGRWIVPPVECIATPATYPTAGTIPPEYIGRPYEPPPTPRYAPPPPPHRVAPPPRRREPRTCPTPRPLVLAGVNLIDEAKRLLATRALQGMKIPNIRIRRVTGHPRTLGMAHFNQHMIRMTDYQGIDKYDVYETLSHEMAHLRTGRHGGEVVGSRPEGAHGPTWKDIFSNVLHQGYRQRIPSSILRSHHGVASDLMRGGPRRNPIHFGWCGCCGDCR